MIDETKGSALARALSKAQAVMEGASKDKTNPAFKSRYADLASVWDACREPLTSNGLAVVQLVTSADKTSVTVETRLLHEGGESLSSTLTLPVEKATAQGVGSAITYARRYGLSAMVGVAPDDDDDANEASRPARTYSSPSPAAQVTPPSSPPPSPPPSNVRNITGAPSLWEVRINEAQTPEALALVGSALQREPEAVRNTHRPIYTRRYTELTSRAK